MEMHAASDVLKLKCKAVDGAVRLAMLLPALPQSEQEQLHSSLSCLRDGVIAMCAADPTLTSAASKLCMHA